MDHESPITTGDEGHERDLNRHRGDEQRNARAAAVARLHGAGVEVPDDLPLEGVVDMLNALEAAERQVEAGGGDLMTEEPPRRAD